MPNLIVFGINLYEELRIYIKIQSQFVNQFENVLLLSTAAIADASRDNSSSRIQNLVNLITLTIFINIDYNVERH